MTVSHTSRIRSSLLIQHLGCTNNLVAEIAAQVGGGAQSRLCAPRISDNSRSSPRQADRPTVLPLKLHQHVNVAVVAKTLAQHRSEQRHTLECGGGRQNRLLHGGRRQSAAGMDCTSSDSRLVTLVTVAALENGPQRSSKNGP